MRRGLMLSPLAPPPSCTRRERRTRAQSPVSSELDLPCPSPGASDPLGGVDALPYPFSCGSAAAAAVLVVSTAKRAAAIRPALGNASCAPRARRRRRRERVISFSVHCRRNIHRNKKIPGTLVR